eukprot:1145487-Pelagomonas_calceolata.AAC.1
MSEAEKIGMWRCSVWLRGCFAPNLAEKGGISNLHQMTSTPGLKLLLGYLIMLCCQNLMGATGGACWWGNPSGQVCTLMPEVTSLQPQRPSVT